MAIIATQKILKFTGNDIGDLMAEIPKNSVIYQKIRQKLIEAEDDDQIREEYGYGAEQFIDHWLNS